MGNWDQTQRHETKVNTATKFENRSGQLAAKKLPEQKKLQMNLHDKCSRKLDKISQ